MTSLIGADQSEQTSPSRRLSIFSENLKSKMQWTDEDMFWTDGWIDGLRDGSKENGIVEEGRLETRQEVGSGQLLVRVIREAPTRAGVSSIYATHSVFDTGRGHVVLLQLGSEAENKEKSVAIALGSVIFLIFGSVTCLALLKHRRSRHCNMATGRGNMAPSRTMESLCLADSSTEVSNLSNRRSASVGFIDVPCHFYMPSTKHLPVQAPDSHHHHHHHHHHHQQHHQHRHCCRHDNGRQMTSSTLFPIGRRSYQPANHLSPTANVTLPRRRVTGIFHALKRTETSWLTSATLKEIFQLQRSTSATNSDVIPRRRNDVGKISGDVVENLRATGDPQEVAQQCCKEAQQVGQPQQQSTATIATSDDTVSINTPPSDSNNNNNNSSVLQDFERGTTDDSKSTSSRHQTSTAPAAPTSTLINVLTFVLLTLVVSVTCSILCSQSPRLDLIIIVPRSLKLGQSTLPRPDLF